MDWNQHGSFHLQWRGDVLVVRYEGVWNEVAARHLHRDAALLWARHPARWAMVGLFEAWEGATPETLKVWLDFFLDAVAHGLGAYAVAMPTALHASMAEGLRRETSKRVDRKDCADLADALQWLSELGYAS
ncbi:hypothetical protein H5407_13735 [Mitsuaria sp. WAJ17]|uniref:hypothetical protein n=1 Tax=Mitsuaria sp. WAJ17 TaxID=2761452 RepID=UPI001601CB04|nr:hypothetical protein [Mitsuaria sp. WAJ17]MBB2486279.1 hypothetical protein [Mitsuaria sp. WAJ17]